MTFKLCGLFQIKGRLRIPLESVITSIQLNRKELFHVVEQPSFYNQYGGNPLMGGFDCIHRTVKVISIEGKVNFILKEVMDEDALYMGYRENH